MFDPYLWPLAHGRTLELGPAARIMGVLNVTPDSFSDGGRYVETDAALAQATAMIAAGADIVDIGGESTRPGAETIDTAEEQRRILPVSSRASAPARHDRTRRGKTGRNGNRPPSVRADHGEGEFAPTI